jgi:hypothetical protein
VRQCVQRARQLSLFWCRRCGQRHRRRHASHGTHTWLL